MKTSKDGKQKTEEGYLGESRVEPEDNQGVLMPSTTVPESQAIALQYCTLERILSKENMLKAYKRVLANKARPGVDGMRVEELKDFLDHNWQQIKQDILQGKYKPQPVRRVDIPKPNGGIRQLGIPTVLDRLIQQAIAQEMTLLFDKSFSENSYAYRPKRSAKDALKKAKEFISQGNTWVIELDLEKFFDRVNHDKLMSRVARKVKDKRVLKIIRAYLNSGAMLNGVKVETKEGTPQGSPLSPILANIMLDDLDKELERRGHKFCRYADDITIYVKSERAARRVKESITRYIEKKLKLKVNKEKSTVDRPWKTKFLGFTFYQKEGEWYPSIAKESIQKLKRKIKKITSRRKPTSTQERIEQINKITRGWINYFSIAKSKSKIEEIDGWIRRRLRMCEWKLWKRIRTRLRKLMELGIEATRAKMYANTRKGYWHTAGSPILTTTLTNKYFEGIGYKSLLTQYKEAQVN